MLKSPAGYIITGKIPDFYKGVMVNNFPPVIPESVIVMRITYQVDPIDDNQIDMETIPINKVWDLDAIGINA